MTPPTGPRTGGTPSSALTPTALEFHSGIVAGRSRRRVVDPPAVVADPRQQLIDVLAVHLRRGPCVVQFSGGRDSSLILALSVQAAREHDLAMPTAVTMRYPGTPSTEESAWQDLVVRLLGVEHAVVVVDPGGNELTSVLGRRQLTRFGPLMPPPCGVTLGRIGPTVRGATVLTGEGGDEVLAPSRISPFVNVVRRRQRPSRAALRTMATWAPPRSVRRRFTSSGLLESVGVTWLRPTAASQVRRTLTEELTDLPWDWRAARSSLIGSRMWAVGEAAMTRVAENEGFGLVHPLMDPLFIGSFAAHGGFLGLDSRTAAVRLLGAGLLPEELIVRQTKAHFNEAYAGHGVREFARTWDGSGVDEALVDVEELRRVWMDDFVPGLSLAPLQLAILESMRSAGTSNAELSPA